MHSLLAITVAITLPGNVGSPNNTRQWTELNWLEDVIIEHDPFNMTKDQRDEASCGPNRSLSGVRQLFRLMATPGFEDEYVIHDDVVMRYWESRDDDKLWTPLCSSRSDLGRVGH